MLHISLTLNFILFKYQIKDLSHTFWEVKCQMVNEQTSKLMFDYYSCAFTLLSLFHLYKPLIRLNKVALWNLF